MNKRKFIATTSSWIMIPIFNTGCAPTFHPHNTNTDHYCGDGSDLDNINCRSDLFLNSSDSYATAAMLVGAALGLGLAIGARAHPLAIVAAGALGGALAYGTVAAAEQYWKYRLEQANGDTAQAHQDIIRDISHDNTFSNRAVSDAKYVTESAISALKNKDGKLIQNTNIYSSTRDIAKKLNRVGSVLQESNKIYRAMPPRVGVRYDDGVRHDLDRTQENAIRIAEDFEKRLVIEMGKDAGYG